MHQFLRALAVAATGALAASLVPGLVASPASAVTTTDVNPRTLPRGADVTIPHLEGKTIVDGATRIRVAAPVVRLLGKSGSDYIVGTARRDGTGGRLHRYEADGTSVQLFRANIYMTQLSDDGQTLVSVRHLSDDKTVVRVRSSSTGATVAERRFRGYPDVLDAEGARVLLGGFDAGTRLWQTDSDTVTLVTRRFGYEGDLAADVLASYTKDPYMGGCTVVSSVSRPAKRIWTSCDDRVDAFNADGTRMATIDILSDGIGPGRVTARSAAGKALGRYVVKRGWFGELTFETTTALLLETHGPRKTATVRCVRSDCERASAMEPTEFPRLAG